MTDFDDLRARIKDILAAELVKGDEDHWATQDFADATTDRILALPEIADALAWRKALTTGEGLIMTVEPPMLGAPTSGTPDKQGAPSEPRRPTT
jgi:hypothetical protein